MVHFGIIRTYTGVLLDMFNELEVQNKDSAGNIHTRNIPIKYSSKEKAHIFDKHTTEQLMSGNYNVLPTASLSFSTLIRDNERSTNKKVKINTYKGVDSFEYQYNAIPYNFTFDLTVKCRGMNEATMVVEQVLPFFNPKYYIDVYEIPNLDEPTRLPISLLDVSIEPEEYEELSQNIVTVNFGLEVQGNIYPPIKSIERIKEFKMQLNEQIGNEYLKKSIFGWDVLDDGTLDNEEHTIPEEFDRIPPNIIDIIGLDVNIGSNDLSVLYEDKDNLITELSFKWDILTDTTGSASVTFDKEKAILNVEGSGDVEVQVTITDYHGNFSSLSKVFTIL